MPRRSPPPAPAAGPCLASSSARRAGAALALLSLVAGCVGPASPPAAERAVRVVVPPPPAAPAVLPTDWRDWPQTPGDWRYFASTGYSSATFGVGQDFVAALTCDRQRRVVTLDVTAIAATPVTIRTSATTRTLATVLRDARGVLPPVTAQAELSANDPLLDAIGFSRGRFTVERPGMPPLVLPAWPEVERVVEDCRS